MLQDFYQIIKQNMKKLQTLLLLLLITTAASETLQIFSATTFLNTPSTSLSGSLRGGRKIYIEGVGFPDPSLLEVWVDVYPCLIAADGTTPTTISCETTDSFSTVDVKSLSIKVISQGQVYLVPGTVFNYYGSDTPSISDVYPSASVAGTRLNYYARHRVLNVGDGLRDMGDFIGLYVGGKTCSMFDIEQAAIGYNSVDRAQCDQSPTQEAGRYNITEKVVAGWAQKEYTMRKPSFSHEYFEHTVLPAISALSPTEGFDTGQNLHIEGTGFSTDPSHIQVSVDEVPCEVTSSTLNSVDCRLAPRDANVSSLIDFNGTVRTDPYIGGSGFTYERYDISSLATKTIAGFRAALPTRSNIVLKESKKIMELEATDIYIAPYAHAIKGYFYAPVSGNYIFRGAGDEQFLLLINPQQGTTTGTLSNVISSGSSFGASADNYYISNYTTSFGAPISLVGGKYYYMEFYHVNTAGSGWFKISVQVPNTDRFLPKQTFEVNHFSTSFTNQPEIIQFILDAATGGSFNLSVTRTNPSTLQVTYSREVSIPHNATTAQFQTALNNFDSYSSAGTVCSSAVAYDAAGTVVDLASVNKTKMVWTVRVWRLRTATQIAQRFRFKGNNLVNLTTSTVTFTQNILQPHCPLIGGTFTLDIGGQSIRLWDSVSKSFSIYNIPYNVGASTLQTALRNIVGFENVEVYKSGESEYGAKWLISFYQYFDDVPDLVLSNSRLTGGQNTTMPQLAFYETRKYSSDLLFNPVNQEFLFTPATTPGVLVTVNGITSVCLNDCSYTFLNSAPSVSGQSKTGSTVSVTITDPLSATYPNTDLTVKVDGRICQISSGAYPTFSCTLPTDGGSPARPLIRAGSYDVEVFVLNKGYVAVDPTLAKLDYDLYLTSLAPSTGGTNGGYLININGAGFPSNPSQVLITLCGVTAQITSITPSRTIIIAPECSTTGSQPISYTYNNITKTISFTYATPTVNAEILEIYPSSFSPVKKGVLTINGTGFGTDVEAITVYLSNSTGKIYQMRVLSVEDDIIKCGIPGGLPGVYNVDVSLAGHGVISYAANSSNVFTYELVITSVSPQVGSYHGGTLVTINGINFSPDILENIVSIGNELNSVCVIESVSESQIRCRMPPTHRDWRNSTQQVIVTNRIIQDSTCPAHNCQFTYGLLADAPVLTSINFVSTDSGRGFLLLTGTKLNATNLTNVQVVLQNKLTGVKTLANVNSATATNINFTVPNVPAGAYLVRARLDPLGETNSLALNLKTFLTSSTLGGSTKGGAIFVNGFGLPSEWPSRLWTLTVTVNSLPVSVTVLSTSPSQLQIQVPEGTSISYSITLNNPISQPVTATFTQTSTNTPTLNLLTSSPLASGSQTIQINKVSLSTQTPTRIYIYNTINPDRLELVHGWTQAGTVISLTYVFPAGQYGFKLWYEGYGWGNCPTTVNVSSQATFTIGNTVSSYAGRKLVISGSDVSPDTLIKVGGFTQRAVTNANGQVVLEIPPLITPETVALHPQLAKQQLIKPEATLNDANGANAGASFDGLQSSFYSSTAAVCYIGLDAGVGKVVNVRRIKYFPYYRWTIAANFIKGAIFEGSNDGTSYTTLGTVDQTVHAGWNSILVSTSTNYRYIRMKHTSTSGCKLSEFQIYGILYNDLTIADVTDFTTGLTFNDGFHSLPFAGVLSYKEVETPIVESVSPNTGTIYGGTLLNITGANFDIGIPEVIIDGVECVLDNTTNVTSTSFACVTGERLFMPRVNSFVVNIGDQHSIIQDQFLYVMRWSDIRTWGTDLPPAEGDLVYVPQGMTLFVDQSTPRLDGIIVENGKLIFADQGPMQIHTNLITVNGGQFRAGTQSKPYQNKLTFIMYGSYYGKQQPMFGNKGIGCMNCKFSMYGTPRVKTWTVLAATISPQATSFTVEDAVDWQVGEEIVVASTEFDHNQAEQRTITGVSGNTFTVNEPFLYRHLSVVETYGSDRLVMKAEVGLLTRNIKMMGDPTSEAGEYGSHLMMTGSADKGMVSHIAYTEFTHCGQPRIVGRYCMHFHMNGDVPDSYAKGNAVHHSFARVITIHGVHFLHVSENVGYRVKGHNFFVEDGIETENVIENNLAIGSLESWNMMQTDISVASFWITNPSNHVRNNRAAGGDFYGFWYEIKPNPDGPSATEDICPIGNPLGQSHDNVAHSYKRFGLRIFKLYSREKPCEPIRTDTLADPWSLNPSIQSRFYNYMIYKNGQAGLLAEETGNMVFDNFTIADSKSAGMEFYRTNQTRELVVAQNSAIIGASQSIADIVAVGAVSGVIAPRTSGWKMTNIRFYNFPATTVCLKTCSKCDSITLYTNTAQEYFVDTISFTNVTGKYLAMNGQKREIIYDTDGTFSANFNAVPLSSATIVWSFKHLVAESACAAANNPNLWDNALACDSSSVIIRKAMFTNLINRGLFANKAMKIQKITDQTQIVPINTSTSYTQFYSLYGNMEPMIDKIQSYSIPLVADRVYNVWWHTGIDWTHLGIDVSKLFVDTDPAIVIKFDYYENRELYEIGHLLNGVIPTGTLINPTTAAPLNRATCNFGDYTHDNTNRTLTVCLTSRGKARPNTYLDINGIKCRYLCPSPAGQFVKENFIREWSNATQWPSSRLPLPGQNVTIPGEWTIRVNMNPAQISLLQIDGDVLIPPNMAEVNITAKGIWIRAGSIKAGTSTLPHPGKINFKLLGVKEDFGFNINEFIGGNKVFVVHGRLQLYGVAPSITWNRAKSIVRPGATSISLSTAISEWQVGDQLVIGPSFNKAQQHQIVTITAVYTGNNSVSFSPSLNFTHYGATGVTVSNTIGTLDTRAAVGHLTRNIKIIAGTDQNWGFHMIIQGYFDGQKLRSGSAYLQGVQFINGGQPDTENTALKIQNTVGSDAITITQSSFMNCQSFCLDVSNINNAVVRNNVFYIGRIKHVRALKLASFTFNNNLMIAAIKNPSVAGAPTGTGDLIACYQTHDQMDSTVSITSNLCQGSDLHGFALSFIPCDQINSSPYSDNTVGSSKIGFIFSRTGGACQAATGVKAYACQIGQICSSPSTQQLMFTKFMIADSGRGATLRFGKEGDDRPAYFSNSYISAISRPTCTECYGANAIDCTNNFGVRMLAVTINGETMPSKFGMFYDTICKQEVFDSKAFLDNIIFQNFNQVYPALPQCSSNVVFKPHDLASDMTGSHHLTNVVCNGCSLNAMALFTPPNPTFLGWEGGCGRILCTGKNNYLIHDHTGTLFGSKSILLANNSEIGDKTDNCTYIPEINGHHCRREDLAVLEYENIAPDFRTRIMWPVYLKYDGGAWNTSTNGWREWDWQGNEPLNHRLGRFVSVVQLYKTYNMTFESEPPIDMRLQIQHRSPTGNNTDWIIVKLHYPRPNSIRVQDRFGIIKPITLLDNNGENPLNTSVCGSNKYFYQNYTVHFVVTGAKDCQVRVSLTNSIQLNARIDMDISTFFSVDGQTKFIDRMCSVLGITDTSRVKIVSIFSGSVEIVAYIDERQATTTDNSTSANDTIIAQEMAALQEVISQAYTNGTLGSALGSAGLGPLINLNTEVHYHYYPAPEPEEIEEQQKIQNSTKIGLIVGVVCGVVVLAVVAVFGFVYFVRKRARIGQVMEMQPSEEKFQAVNISTENDSTTFGFRK